MWHHRKKAMGRGGKDPRQKRPMLHVLDSGRKVGGKPRVYRVASIREFESPVEKRTSCKVKPELDHEEMMSCKGGRGP